MYTTDFTQTGKNIQRAINEQNLTYQEVSDRLNISTKAVSDIINGRKAINMNEITKIAEAIGVSVGSLIYFVDNQAKDGETVPGNEDMIDRVISEIYSLETLLEDTQ